MLQLLQREMVTKNQDTYISSFLNCQVEIEGAVFIVFGNVCLLLHITETDGTLFLLPMAP